MLDAIYLPTSRRDPSSLQRTDGHGHDVLLFYEVYAIVTLYRCMRFLKPTGDVFEAIQGTSLIGIVSSEECRPANVARLSTVLLAA